MKIQIYLPVLLLYLARDDTSLEISICSLIWFIHPIQTERHRAATATSADPSHVLIYRFIFKLQRGLTFAVKINLKTVGELASAVKPSLLRKSRKIPVHTTKFLVTFDILTGKWKYSCRGRVPQKWGWENA